MFLDEVLATLTTLPDDGMKAKFKQEFLKKNLRWFPTLGPQADAYESKADELFYGGQAGGGKTHLAIGLALTSHKRSLILRRVNKDAVKIVPFIADVLGTRDGYNGQDRVWKLPDEGRQIDISGCEYEEDKQRFKGDPHDLILFDEGTDFLESQFRFIIGWNRSADPDQHCRVLVTSNPPTTAEGAWVIKYWGPWLDPTHPKPARPGELRWFTTIGGQDQEVDGPGPHVIPGEPDPVLAKSRTFIPAALKDNPYLARTDYAARLAALPDELRRAYRDGDFTVGMRDAERQVIPTQWIVDAQNRWKPDGHKDLMMTAMGLDIGAGRDETVVASRFGAWYAPLQTVTGEQAKDPAHAAQLVVKYRRNGCPVVVDVGGGFGGASLLMFKANDIPCRDFNGASSSSAKTRDGKLSFINKRAEAWWKFREELDPGQQGGAVIALPPDPQLRADLAAPTWKLALRGIQIESKDDIKKRLGRSPDRGDATVMALSEGSKAAAKVFGGPMPKVVLAPGPKRS